MNELEKIYKSWSNTQSDNPEIIQVWSGLYTYLHEHCSEIDRELIEDYAMHYSKKIEQQAFYAGFQQAFLLILEVLTEK